MATNNKKPTHTVRCGNIKAKATIWQNASEKGPFFATTFCILLTPLCCFFTYRSKGSATS